VALATVWVRREARGEGCGTTRPRDHETTSKDAYDASLSTRHRAFGPGW
jgi:hypothetical protein